MPAVPAASALRVLATAAIVAWHSLASCGPKRDCKGINLQSDASTQFLSSFLVVHTDIFFVLTAYLVTVGRCGTEAGRPLRSALVDRSAAVLRRVARTAPVLLVAQCLKAESLRHVLALAWPGLVLGIRFPGAVSIPSWPFGIELVCLAVVEALRLVSEVFGDTSAMAAAAALLAACLERRRSNEFILAREGIEPRGWHLAHVAIGAHRLPLCLASVLLTLLLSSRLRADGAAAAATASGCASSAIRLPRRMVSQLLLPAAWLGLLCGLCATATMEWFWNMGPRTVLPYWAYPFPVKLPLVVGCILLLEASRRCSAASSAVSFVSALERRSLAVLVIHQFVETRISDWLPPHAWELRLYLAMLPAQLSWSLLAAVGLTWVADPLRNVLLRALAALQSRVRQGGGSAAAGAALLALPLLALASAAKTLLVCCEEGTSPCAL
eukprot:TRINITY_DN32210_c0_g1_i1.p1 TRINITY_DN32210_c0_g1~~TRINITY_DN32210_c0_g1_i1.p1  ORF type:complete len:440 (+),score=80.72 TRINITY_DN32210_c0_g1_i1:706-2025(+)